MLAPVSLCVIASSFSEWSPLRRTGSVEIDSSAPKIADEDRVNAEAGTDLERGLLAASRLPLAPPPLGWQVQPVAAGEVAQRIVALMAVTRSAAWRISAARRC
jgi:hypothetical protein